MKDMFVGIIYKVLGIVLGLKGVMLQLGLRSQHNEPIREFGYLDASLRP